MFFIALLLSVVGLALGPALVFAGRRRALISAAVEGLTLGLVPLLIILRLLPHVMEELGASSLLLCGAGYGGLWLIDRKRHALGDRVGLSVLIPALSVHALTDGATLGLVFAGAGEHQSAGMLAGLALLVHRMPEGLLIATRFVPLFGWAKTLIGLSLLAGATVVGAVAGQGLEKHVPEVLFDGVVALGLGAMLRLSAHIHSPPEHERGSQLTGGLGFVIGVAFALLLPAKDSLLWMAQAGELSPAESAGPLFVAIAPFLLAGLMASALLTARRPDHAGGDGIRKALFRGLSHPARSGFSLRHWLVHEHSPGSWLAFGVASAGLDAVGLLVSIPLLGFRLGLARYVSLVVVLGALLWMLSRVKGQVASSEGAEEAHAAPALKTHSHRAKWMDGLEMLAPVGVWVAFGLCLSSLLEAHFPPAAVGFVVDHLPGAWSLACIAGGALLGALLAFPSVAAIFVGALLIHKGFSPGMALAFLTASPVSGIGLGAAIRRRWGKRVFGICWGLGMGASIGLGALYDGVVETRGIPELHPLAQAPMHATSIAAAVVVLVLMTASVLALGPRAFLSALVKAVVGPSVSHEHGDHTHHAHTTEE